MATKNAYIEDFAALSAEGTAAMYGAALRTIRSLHRHGMTGPEVGVVLDALDEACDREHVTAPADLLD